MSKEEYPCALLYRSAMVPDAGYREKARDDIIAVVKLYRWHGMLVKGNLNSYYDVTHAMGLVLSWVMRGFHKQDGILKLGCDDYLLKFTFDGDPITAV